MKSSGLLVISKSIAAAIVVSSMVSGCNKGSSGPSEAETLEKSIPSSLSFSVEAKSDLTDQSSTQLTSIVQTFRTLPDTDLIYSLPSGATQAQVQDRSQRYEKLSADSKSIVDEANSSGNCVISNPSTIISQDFAKDSKGFPMAGSEQDGTRTSTIAGESCPLLDLTQVKQSVQLKLVNYNQDDASQTKVVGLTKITFHMTTSLQDKAQIAKHGQISETVDFTMSGPSVAKGPGESRSFMKGSGAYNLIHDQASIPMAFEVQALEIDSADLNTSEAYFKLSIPLDHQTAIFQIHTVNRSSGSSDFSAWMNGNPMSKDDVLQMFGSDFSLPVEVPEN